MKGKIKQIIEYVLLGLFAVMFLTVLTLEGLGVALPSWVYIIFAAALLSALVCYGIKRIKYIQKVNPENIAEEEDKDNAK